MDTVVIKQRKNPSALPGFEQLGFHLHPDTNSEFPIPFVNGKFDTGLDKTPDKKSYFEDLLLGGQSFESIAGQEFLNNFIIDLSHDETIMPDNPMNQFKIHLLNYHNGFGLIKVTDKPSGPIDTFLFEMVDQRKELTERVTKKQVFIKAGALLQDMWEKEPHKVLLLGKFLFEVNSGIETPEAAYDKIADYIENYGQAQHFLRIVDTDLEMMEVTVDVKNAIMKNIIRMENNRYVNFVTKTIMGKNMEEVVRFCLDPKNQDEYGSGASSDGAYTIKSQLKNSLR
jgi:hypothetical protein